MSPEDRAAHAAHEDERNRLAGLRKLQRHDLELYEHNDRRWQRRMQACLPVVNPRPCDFEGCVE